MYAQNSRKPVVTDSGIYGFFGRYRFLSTIEDSPMTLDGIPYPSAEHALAAERTQDESAKRAIAQQTSAPVARKLGLLQEPRPDWDSYEEQAILRVMRAKFTQNPEMAKKLLATGNRHLEDTDDWDGQGLNKIGKALLVVREELRRMPNLEHILSGHREPSNITSRPPRC